jgi:hypothetical protein
MGPIEIVAVISGVLASFTFCAVKILHQVQNSKCKFIRCCGSECVRDVDVDLPEADTSSAPVPPRPPIAMTAAVKARPPSGVVRLPPPPRPRVKALREMFESGR